MDVFLILAPHPKLVASGMGELHVKDFAAAADKLVCHLRLSIVTFKPMLSLIQFKLV